MAATVAEAAAFFLGLIIFGLGAVVPVDFWFETLTFSWLVSALGVLDVYLGGVPKLAPLVDPVSYNSEYLGGLDVGFLAPLPPPPAPAAAAEVVAAAAAASDLLGLPPAVAGVSISTTNCPVVAVDLILDVLLQAASLLYFLSFMKSVGFLGTKLKFSVSHLGSFSQNCSSLSFLFLKEA